MYLVHAKKIQIAMKISIHPLFVLTAGVIIWFAGVGVFLVLVVAVLVHEGAHVWVANRYGIRTKRLRLLPCGGQIEIEAGFLPSRARIAILLAGAGGNVVFALGLGLFLWMFPAMFVTWEMLILANALIAVLNLLPLYPLDGGKILGIIFPKLGSFFRKIKFLNGSKSIMLSNFKTREKSGKVVEVALPASATLFEAYKMVHRSSYTKFILRDKGVSFYEVELEELLMRHNLDDTLGSVLDG